MPETPLLTEEQPALVAPKGPKISRPRRSYDKELSGIKAYCLAAIDIIKNSTDAKSDFGRGQIAMAQSVLNQLGVKVGK